MNWIPRSPKYYLAMYRRVMTEVHNLVTCHVQVEFFIWRWNLKYADHGPISLRKNREEHGIEVRFPREFGGFRSVISMLLSHSGILFHLGLFQSLTTTGYFSYSMFSRILLLRIECCRTRVFMGVVLFSSTAVVVENGLVVRA